MTIQSSRAFYSIVVLATVLAFCVVVLGAYVRLSDAGLGCPDWPGCYGHLTVPEQPQSVAGADARYPGRPLQAAKAWKEMIHRYAAGTLGLLILALAALALKRRREPGQPVVLPVLLLALVCFQAALGMWTVTLLLKPIIVTSHLIGGMLTVALLLLLLLRSGGHLRAVVTRRRPLLRFLAGAGLCVLCVQIFLGAWTSTNYAALACPDFPTCQGHWWPPTNYAGAYTLWRGLHANFEYRVLSNVERMTIHMTHRVGALVTFLALGGIALYLLARERTRAWRGLGALLGLALCAQVAMGIAIVQLQLPLWLADGHNAGAALLLLVMTALNYAAWRARMNRSEVPG